MNLFFENKLLNNKKLNLTDRSRPNKISKILGLKIIKDIEITNKNTNVLN